VTVGLFSLYLMNFMLDVRVL